MTKHLLSPLLCLLLACGVASEPTPVDDAAIAAAAPDSPATVAPELATGATCIPLNVGDAWQAKVSAAPTGAAFCPKAGTHVRQSVTPKAGQAFRGEPGAVMDGQGATATAFGGSAANVTIKGLAIRNYHPADASQGMIQAPSGPGWVVDSNEISGSAMQGFRVGRHAHVGWNYIHDNYVTGGGGYKADSLLIEWNHFQRNPPTYTAELSGGTRMAQIKVFKSVGVIVRNNLIEGGAKKGIWFDTDNYLTLIEGNTIRGQGQACVWYEADYAGTIRNNILAGCGVNTTMSWIQNACVQVTNSSPVEIYGNTCSGADNGIVGMAVGHASNPDYTTGTRGLKALGLQVHDNSITQSVGVAAGVRASGTGADSAFIWAGRSTFLRNRYNTTGNALTAWTWRNVNVNKAKWQSFGFDVAGTFTP